MTDELLGSEQLLTDFQSTHLNDVAHALVDQYMIQYIDHAVYSIALTAEAFSILATLGICHSSHCCDTRTGKYVYGET